MSEETKSMALMGGDPTMVKASLLDPRFFFTWHQSEAALSIEVPCQQCGRMVLIAPSGQRVALGEEERVVPLDREAFAKGEVKAGGPSEPAGPCAVLCMWCACAGTPSIIEALDKALANAKKKLEAHDAG